MIESCAALRQMSTAEWPGRKLVPGASCCASSSGSLVHFACVHAESGGVRPFGVSLMLAGHDANGPQLYQIDPSGTFFAWKASAVGKNMVNAKTFLEKRYADDLELEDAIDIALLTLKESFEGEMSGDNIEVQTTPMVSTLEPRVASTQLAP
jgi:20S proteasome subunit alpha 2